MDFTLFPNVTSVIDVQLLNALSAIVSTESPITAFFNAVQPLNAQTPMFFTPFPVFIPVSPTLFSNALSPILVTVSGIV